MKTAVMIDLDYLMNSEEACRIAWAGLETAFLNAGYSVQDRLFTIAIPHIDATLRAEAAIRQATARLKLQGVALGNVIKNCFAFQVERFTPLDHPHPEACGIDVDFIDADVFGRFSALREMA